MEVGTAGWPRRWQPQVTRGHQKSGQHSQMREALMGFSGCCPPPRDIFMEPQSTGPSDRKSSGGSSGRRLMYLKFLSKEFPPNFRCARSLRTGCRKFLSADLPGSRHKASAADLTRFALACQVRCWLRPGSNGLTFKYYFNF